MILIYINITTVKTVVLCKFMQEKNVSSLTLISSCLALHLLQSLLACFWGDSCSLHNSGKKVACFGESCKNLNGFFRVHNLSTSQ